MNLLTGFEAFGLPVKYFTLGVSVVILDGASDVQILYGASTVAQGECDTTLERTLRFTGEEAQS